ncbi:hypothetical protein OG897_14570 [Streptomyces sp. NBC_00237]|uniref:hypothetical protein n=1 Tax=Streptomyces sp. NBC_00237 TaxID=2975687 RepID=UPI00224FE597|nr:hypothetical protein [Streptomyces sp. NBC_00237]MCX5202670.1 hypothetical protein [Streptomyces sp. NBC_00237]
MKLALVVLGGLVLLLLLLGGLTGYLCWRHLTAHTPIMAAAAVITVVLTGCGVAVAAARRRS